MTYTDKNGEIFTSKEDYERYMRHVQNYINLKKGIRKNFGARYEKKYNIHQINRARKMKCPKCGTVEKLTTNFAGDLMCSNCFVKEL